MSNVTGAKVMKVIRTISSRGNGTKENPNRYVFKYWDFKGNLLAENDPESKKE